MKFAGLKKCFSLSILLATLFATSLYTSNSWAYGLGISSQPLAVNKSVLTTEFVGHMSRGTGTGIQARFTRKFTSAITFDAGAGYADSQRAGRFFLGSDIEFFPDYENQPRISFKAFYENAKEFSKRRNIFGVAPLVSKSLLFRDHQINPFVSIPLALSLNENDRYDVRAHLAFGATTNLPIEGYEKLLVNVEGNVNLSNSFNGLFLGLSYPLN